MAILGLACATEPDWRPAEVIAGKWAWVESRNIATGEIHTPATTGYTAHLELTATTSNAGTFTYTASDRPPIQGQFTVAYEDAPGNDFISIAPSIDFLTQNAWLAAGSEVMILDGVFEGGFMSRYVRVPL